MLSLQSADSSTIFGRTIASLFFYLLILAFMFYEFEFDVDFDL